MVIMYQIKIQLMSLCTKSVYSLEFRHSTYCTSNSPDIQPLRKSFRTRFAPVNVILTQLTFSNGFTGYKHLFFMYK